MVGCVVLNYNDSKTTIELINRIGKMTSIDVIVIVDNNDKGIIEIEALEKLIKTNTTLISMTAVNSEIGIIQPIKEIAQIVKKYPKAYFHTDITQSLGKERIEKRFQKFM